MNRLLLSLLLLFTVINNSFSQTPLTKSRKSSPFTYIYRLTDKQAYKIVLNSKIEIKRPLQDPPIDSFVNKGNTSNIKALPYGNYLLLSTLGNQLHYEFWPVSNVSIDFLRNNKEMKFVLTDLANLQVKDAIVHVNKKQILYNPKLNNYSGPLNKKHRVIEVQYNGVTNFFKCAIDEPANWKRPFFKRIFSSGVNEKSKESFLGNLIFNKPVYRPGDTVRFKAYLLDHKGKSIGNRTLSAFLVKESNEDKKLITVMKPYRTCGYEGSFVLSDTLGLKLDQYCTLKLEEQVSGQRKERFSARFKYEDYLLTENKVSVRKEFDNYFPGRPIFIYAKATDANDLPIADGRVEVLIKADYLHKKYQDHLFVKDTLWTTKQDLDPIGETKIAVPESIFPNGDLSANVEINVLNSNNELLKTTTNIRFDRQKSVFKLSYKKDSLTLVLETNGKLRKEKVMLYTHFPKGKVDSDLVYLPRSLPINQNVNLFRIKSLDGEIFESDVYRYEPDMRPNIAHTIDSIKVVIPNKFNIPFWFTIVEDGKVLSTGYSNKLDTAVLARRAESNAQVYVNYIWAGRAEAVSSASSFNLHKLNISLNAPRTVYPGEVVDMEVKVVDSKNNPLPFADLTAYAHTAKFMEISHPTLPTYPKKLKVLGGLRNLQGNATNVKGNRLLEWEKWHSILGLDTIAFYQFLNSREVVVFKERIGQPTAIVVPFAVANGAIEPAQTVYVDDKLVYYNQTDQLKHYAFPVTPGKHVIRLRTANFEISYEDEFVSGIKTIFSIAAILGNPKARVQAVTPLMLQKEKAAIQPNLIRITNNFGSSLAFIDGRKSTLLLNPPYGNSKQTILVGPFDSDSLTFKSGPIREAFKRGNGLIYTFRPGEVAVQPASILSSLYLSSSVGNENRDYTQNPLLKSDVDSIWSEYLNLRSSTNTTFPWPNLKGKVSATLNLEIDNTITKDLPYLKNIVVYSQEDPSFRFIRPGMYNFNYELPIGKYSVMLLFKDNRYCIADDVNVLASGKNYYQLKNLKVYQADLRSILLDNEIKAADKRTIASYQQEPPTVKPRTADISQLMPGLPRIRMVGSVTDAVTGERMVGAYLSAKFGDTMKIIAVVQGDGRFDLTLPKGVKILCSFVGYETYTIKAKNATNLSIQLKESRGSLAEQVVIRGYSSPGMRGTTNIRGLSTISTTMGDAPVIYLDGKIYEGKLDDFPQGSIASIEVSTDNNLYGSAAKNGVILIKSINNSSSASDSNLSENQSLRPNFSDYAIWEPKLQTDMEGKAHFKVKFPDDVTSWTTRVLAMNDHRQSGYLTTEIRSFKSLSSNFVSPQFALFGDSINVVGKLMNYKGKSEQVTRKLVYNGKEILSSSLRVDNAHLDTVAIKAPSFGSDSLHFEYSLSQSNGYFDGELRKIPLLPRGIRETIGTFQVLRKDTLANYQFDAAKGQVIVRAEASVFPVLLDEVEKIKSYEYLCNEQLASKLKALLFEKDIRKQLGQDFKEQKAIRMLIRKLELNSSRTGLWGWWSSSPEELWISLHVIDALMKAKAQGYPVNIEETALAMNIIAKLNGAREIDQFFALKMLPMLQVKYDAKDWICYFEKQFAAEKTEQVTLLRKLQLLQTKQNAGIPIKIDWLLALKKHTVFGNIYWGEENTSFWDNSIQNTLLAYQILKAEGKHSDLLKRIQGYFLEQRKDGQWRNTYESSLILETILPDMLAEKEALPSSLIINDDVVKVFPYVKSYSTANLMIKKTSAEPIYFTAYQQFNNDNPVKVDQVFKVKSSVYQKGLLVKSLKAGIPANLQVEVEVPADADYVMVELPIPAGCSYQNKNQSFDGVETHREYFKNKTSIFCKKLKKGTYKFELQLMPRFTGGYTLNPAKAEMMYFPVNFGREGMKKIDIN